MPFLRFPAPLREPYSTERGMWATRPWTLQGVEDVLRYGGWFHQSAEFENEKVARRAKAGSVEGILP